MVSSIGPVHPDTREAEFKQIKKGSYNVYVEVHVSFWNVNNIALGSLWF